VKNLIEVKELSKSYKRTKAIDRVSWSLPEGSITGLLGSNGVGKTTTLKVLLGIAYPDSGSANVGGYDISTESLEIRKITAFVPEEKGLIDRMRACDFLHFYGGYGSDWNEERARQLADQWNLPWDNKIKTYSKGMRGRLTLISAILRNPEVLLLDEPTDGMDPEGVEMTLQQCTGWVGEGNRGIIISTHRLDEVERICDRVILMKQGRVLLEEEMDYLKENHKLIQVAGNIPETELNRWSELFGWEREGNIFKLFTNSSPDDVMKRLNVFNPTHLEAIDLNLREIYLSLTKERSH
jgi:ABC-2 type transport system ATP-binding protein